MEDTPKQSHVEDIFLHNVWFSLELIIFLFHYMLRFRCTCDNCKLSLDSSQFEQISSQCIRTHCRSISFILKKSLQRLSKLVISDLVAFQISGITFRPCPGIPFSFLCLEFPISWIPCLLLSCFTPLFWGSTSSSSFLRKGTSKVNEDLVFFYYSLIDV